MADKIKLLPGESLHIGDALVSPNKEYRLELHHDCFKIRNMSLPEDFDYPYDIDFRHVSYKQEFKNAKRMTFEVYRKDGKPNDAEIKTLRDKLPAKSSVLKVYDHNDKILWKGGKYSGRWNYFPASYAQLLNSGNLMLVDDNFAEKDKKLGRWVLYGDFDVNNSEIEFFREQTISKNDFQKYESKGSGATFWYCLAHMRRYPENQVHVFLHEDCWGDYFFETMLDEGKYLFVDSNYYNTNSNPIHLKQIGYLNSEVGHTYFIFNRKGDDPKFLSYDTHVTQKKEEGFDTLYWEKRWKYFGIGAYYPKVITDTRLKIHDKINVWHDYGGNKTTW